MYTLLWVIIAAQIFMGALDTLVHHELTEKLAWRKGQETELRLHAIRNLFYAVLFFALGVTQPGGLWAYAAIFALCFEFLVTLRDFAEEDLTRKLPMSERMLHTVLTANYGIILALLIPVLWSWGDRAAGFTPVWYGLWSVMMIIGALGVLVLAARDLHAARRLGGLVDRPLSALMRKAQHPKHILITGGTGFIGQRLIPALQAAGHRVTVLTRNVKTADLPAPITLIDSLGQIDTRANIDVIINLAGESLSNGFWTAKKKRAMYDSRIGLTNDLVNLIDRLASKPELLLSGSAIGVYGVNPKGAIDERYLIPDDGTVSQDLCREWEAAAHTAETRGVRVVALRIGMVLGLGGGALGQILVPTELGGGATFGRGDHMMSWITRDDIVGLIGHIMDNPDIHGPVNGTAPHPVSNLRFTKAVAKALYRPTLIRVPRFVIKALGGLGREILLADQDIRPAKALAAGYVFKDENIEEAMMRMLRAVKNEIPQTIPDHIVTT